MTKCLSELANLLVMEAVISSLANGYPANHSECESLSTPNSDLMCNLLVAYLSSIGLVRLSLSSEDATGVVDSTCVIQRLVRGFLGRQEARRRRQDEETKSESITRQFYAGVIQQHFRGHLYRKNNKDLRKRASFLHHIQRVNEDTRKTLKNASEHNIKSAIRRSAKTRQEATLRDAKTQHHLISTYSQASVFNSEFSGPRLTEWGIPVETLIKHVYK